MKARLVFVVGPPRSGTTLLQSILAAHSIVTTLPETHFFERVIPSLGIEYFDPESSFPAEGIRRAYEELARQGFAVPCRDKVNNQRSMSTRTAFEHLVACFADENAGVLVEKTPAHACYIPEIKRFYPDAKFIGLVRHPVESVGSMYNMRPVSLADMRLRYTWSLSSLTRYWGRCCEGILEWQDHGLQITKYEDLIQCPENTIRETCSFLGIDYEPTMLSEFGSCASRFVRVTESPWKMENLANEIRDNREKWRRKLPAGKIWLIEECAEGLLEELGYQRTVFPGWISRKRALLQDEILRRVIRSRLEDRIRKLLLGIQDPGRHRLKVFSASFRGR